MRYNLSLVKPTIFFKSDLSGPKTKIKFVSVTRYPPPLGTMAKVRNQKREKVVAVEVEMSHNSSQASNNFSIQGNVKSLVRSTTSQPTP